MEPPFAGKHTSMAIHTLDTLWPLSDFHPSSLVTKHELSQLRSCPHTDNGTFPVHCELCSCGQMPPRLDSGLTVRRASTPRLSRQPQWQGASPLSARSCSWWGSFSLPAPHQVTWLLVLWLCNHINTDYCSQLGLPWMDGVAAHSLLPRRPTSLSRV